MMHPDFIHALGRERHAELLREQQFRNSRADRWPVDGSRGPVDQLRRSLGTALVAAGTRLMPANRPAQPWGLTASRHSTMR